MRQHLGIKKALPVRQHREGKCNTPQVAKPTAPLRPYYSISGVMVSTEKGGAMASTRKLNTKDGKPFYEIIVSRGRGKSPLTTRWYPPEGWSQRTIDRELEKVKSDFERRVKAGEVLSREEEREQARQRAQEAAQIKTLRIRAAGIYARYGYQVRREHP